MVSAISRISIAAFLLLALAAQASAGSLTANQIIVTNAVIDVGQTTVVNTIVSGGAGSGYSGQWTWQNSNGLDNIVANTITVGWHPTVAAFNPSGTLLYVTNPATLNVISPSTNSLINTITGFDVPIGVAISPSGALAYVANNNNLQMGVVNVASNTLAGTVINVGSSAFDVAFNPSGKLAYVTNNGDSTISVIDAPTNTVVNTLSVGSASSPIGVAFSPSGKVAYVANNNAGTVNVISVATNTVGNAITVGTSPYGVAINPEGTMVYVANNGGTTVSVIDIATNTVVNTIIVGSQPTRVAFNPSGTLAYITNDGGTTVSVINVATNTVVNTITVGSTPIGVAFNPLGTAAYVANYGSGNISVIANIPETSLQELPSGGSLKLIANAVSQNKLTLTFNGVQYNESTGTSTVYGKWSLYSFAQDNKTKVYYYGSNTVMLFNSITINPALSTPTLNSIPANVGINSQVKLGASWGGGSPSYTVNYLIANSVTGAVLGNYLVTGLSGTSNAFTWNVPPSDIGNSIAASVSITDSASTPVTVNSVNSAFQIVNTSLVNSTVKYTRDNSAGGLISSATSNTNANYAAGYYDIAAISFNGIKTINNQSPWSVYENGALVTTTNSLYNFSEQAAPGTYNFTFKNPGNANYSYYTFSVILSVSQLGGGGGGGGGGSTVSTTVTTSSSTVSTTTNTTVSTTTNTTSYTTTAQTTTVQTTTIPVVNLTTTGPSTVNVTVSPTSPVSVNVQSAHVILTMSSVSGSAANVSITASNATKKTPPPPHGFTKVV
ncbi:MAG: YncE family protein, partial [Candidatus Micrarchaeota archaeon]|nr:YncE family protein [Candidatus Micrarchaeota archaeon]